MPSTTRDDALLPIVEDLVERQRQILGALVATTHPLKNDVQAVLLGLRGVVTKLRNEAVEADDSSTAITAEQVATRLEAIAQQVHDEGALATWTALDVEMLLKGHAAQILATGEVPQ